MGKPIAVVVGQAGLAWAEAHGAGPVKQEGDTRTPAGVFRLREAWGTAASAPAGTRLSYRQSGAATRCVDDPGSREYNRILDESGDLDWKSAEIMRRADGLYDWVVVVGHNEARAPGAGSCIFLHVWRSPRSPTVGCTAMPKATLAALMTWIDPEAAVLVVLPEPVRKAVGAEIGLPR